MTYKSYVTPGHPTAAGAGYDCNCGQCLEARSKDALDGKGSPTHAPGFSMAVLWNMNAHNATTAALAFGPISEIPLDGDALARSANRNMLTAWEWRQIQGGQLEALRNNHAETNRPNR